MPSKHTIRSYAPDTYYHVFNRGVNKQNIFVDQEDYAVFLNLFKRYLDAEPHKDNKGREYEWMHEDVELLAYCLMPNHFHLLFYLKNEQSLSRLMRAVITSYSTYFNKKYGRVGHLFQDKFKATHIFKDTYLLNITRYIHLNPSEYKNWEWSSLAYYLGKKHARWLNESRISALFSNDYRDFLEDYVDYKKSLDVIKEFLANG